MNHQFPTSTPAGSSQTLSLPDEKQKPRHGSGTLALLRVAALGLPGLVSQTAMADQDASWLAASSPTVGIQAGAGYVPTGASRLLGQLEKASTSVKKYKISCFDDSSGQPTKLRLRIQGMSTANFLVNAKIESNGVSQDITDKINGDRVYSDYISVSRGLGEYILTISKVKKSANAPDSALDGAMTFQTAQECNTSSGAYTGITHPKLTDSGHTPPVTPPVTPVTPPSSSKLATYSSSLIKNANSSTYFVNCTANKADQGTVRYKFQIKSANPNRPFNLRMTVKKDGGEARTMDNINGDKLFSELAELEAGNGRYEINVSKDNVSGDTNKAMSFAIKHVCETQELTHGKLSVSKK
jgi:hypothetical protein